MILLSQTLICNDKINDGACCTTELLLTEGFGSLGDAPCWSWFPWMPMFRRLSATCGRLRPAVPRLHQEIVSTYTVPRNVPQGSSIDRSGRSPAS